MSAGHEWVQHEREGWSVCSRCGMVRNYNRETTTCRGALPTIRQRSEIEDCGQDGVCALSPGCNRHWEERNRELVRENEVLRSNSDHLSSENASLSSQVESMAMRIESLAEELSKPDDVRLREVLDELDGRAVIFDSLASRVRAVLDDLDEHIARAGSAERTVETQKGLLLSAQRIERDLRQQLAHVSTLADERLAHANQLQADIEAEQQGRLALRKRLGAREDETMGAFIERLATMAGVVPAEVHERDELREKLADCERRYNELAEQPPPAECRCARAAKAELAELREKLAKAERQVESHLKELIRTRNELDEAVHTLDRLKAHQFRAAIEALREKAKTHRSWSPEQPSAYTVAAAWLESQAPKSEALLPAISPDDERVVDELMSKRAAGLGERSMVPKAEPDAEAEARRRLARNGRVSTSGLTPEQVAFSRAFDELHVEPDGLGWVRREWFEALKRAERGERG